MKTRRVVNNVFLMGVAIFFQTAGIVEVQAAPSAAFPIGPESVWQPSDSFVSQHRAAMGKNLIAVMQKGGASVQAIGVARLLKGEQYLSSFKEMGPVDLGTISSPLANYADTEYVLLNGQPPLIEVFTFPSDKIYGLKLKHDLVFRSLLPKYPQLGPMGRHEFVGMQTLAGGGKRFVFSEAFQEFRAGPIPARAHIAFDFDRQGKFLGAKFLKVMRSDN